MKLLTMNTHSLLEADYEKKLDVFLDFLLRRKPDIIALQEVNQSADAKAACDIFGMERLSGVEVPLKDDNHALRIVQRLKAEGIACSWLYLPIKLGYGRYDEGAALISLGGRIAAADAYTVSLRNDYQSWRTRRIAGIQIDGRSDWFYSVHMGFWQDVQEPFAKQWRRLNRQLCEKKKHSRVWLMGDFNSPAEVRGQGYDLIAASGWQDAYLLAKEKDEGFTVRGAIDGWRDLPEGDANLPMRIDHIWCSESVEAGRCSTVFSGRHEPVISDHFGVFLEI